MKITVNELKKLIEDAINEASKIKINKDLSELGVYDSAEDKERPDGYKSSETVDFSKPLKKDNRYKKQGSSNMGPWTSESLIKSFVKKTVNETLASKNSRINENKKVDYKRLFKSWVSEQLNENKINSWKAAKFLYEIDNFDVSESLKKLVTLLESKKKDTTFSAKDALPEGWTYSECVGEPYGIKEKKSRKRKKK